MARSAVVLAASSPLSRLHPFVVFGYAIVLGLLPVFLENIGTLTVCLFANLSLAYWDQTPHRLLLRRLLTLNALMVLLWLTLPWSFRGDAWQVGTFGFAREAIAVPLSITLRANAIVVALTVFLSRLDPVTLGHCLERLRVPKRFARLFQLSVRYIDLFDEELVRIRRAMSARSFGPSLTRHTLSAFGYLVGGVLVRAYDRAHRIETAMICRGFSGRFPVARAESPVPRAQTVLLAAVTLVVTCGALGSRLL
jgi:cobalt/nickel transport system permease protein